MQAGVATEQGDVSVVERDRPVAGRGTVVVGVEACGLCGGDEPVLAGADGVEYPRVPGHELAGRVAAVGEGVTDWAVGDRVAAGWHGGHCFGCDQCLRGRFTTCREKAVTGLTRDGGLAEYAVVREEALVPIPDGLSATEAGPLCCAGLTAFNALRDSEASGGDLVAVQGIGGVGHMGVQVADTLGFETVALSRGPDKRAAAFELGASAFVDTTAEDPTAALQDRGGAAAILATAPAAGALSTLVGGLAPEGELLVVGAPSEPLRIPAGPLLDNRWTVRGWSAGHPGDGREALEFAVGSELSPWTETFGLDEFATALDVFTDGDPRFRVVVQP